MRLTSCSSSGPDSMKMEQIAIAVVKESSKAVNAVSSVIVFPIFPLAFSLAYFVFWVYVVIFVFSVQGDLANPITATVPRI